MDGDPLVGLLGHVSSDTSVETALVEMRTRRRPELDPEDRDGFRDWVLIRRQGVELGFVDAAYYHAEERRRRRKKGTPLVLDQVYFYTERDDIEAFPGHLPMGLKWSDNRQRVRRMLNIYQANGRLYKKDVWDFPGYRMTVDYKEGDKAIDSIVCRLDLDPWPEEGRMQPTLSVSEWVSLFGMPATSPAVQERLLPLKLAKRMRDEDEEREVDFRYECGLELYFVESKQLKLKRRSSLTKPNALLFGAARFYRSRYLDARQYLGELPFELSFDDTQNTLFSKIGRTPDEQKDEKFEGYALWRFPDYSLHVLYSNMDNYLVQITLEAPGFS